jgi:TolA-binding protein
LKKGLIYYNESKDQLALTTLKKVVSDFPATSDSKEALVTIRNIYVDMDQVDEFFKYVKDIPFANVSDSEQDSITYIAIENRYMKDDCGASMPGFTEYLKKFPQGAYRLDAHFYLAECQYHSGMADSAALNYEFVADKPKSKFTETSLVKLSEIYYNKKNYEKALGVYADLEKNAEYKENMVGAVTGQMRCNYQLGFYQNAILSARKLITKDKLSTELIEESHLTIAKSAIALDSSSLAMSELIYIGKICTNEKAAEAKYLLAEMYYKNGNYTEAEKTAFDLINQMPAYDYWLAKSFILLADNYVKTGNIHQAKYTLKSIIENYEGADLIKIAQERLNKIIEDEKLEEQRKADELLRQQNATPPPPDVNLINE